MGSNGMETIMNKGCLCLATLLAFAGTSRGELLEMRLFALGSSGTQDRIPFDIVSNDTHGLLECVFVWDTEAPPTQQGETISFFAIQDYEIVYHDIAQNPNDAVVITSEIGGDIEFKYTAAAGGNGTLEIQHFFSIPAGDMTFTLNLIGLEGPFSAMMTSLPDLGEDYAVNVGNEEVNEVVVRLIEPGVFDIQAINGGGFSSSTTAFSGRSGSAVRYAVSVHTPVVEPCSAADLNGDGELDFIDISEFLVLFGKGCP